MRTNRPLWEGATLELNWKVGWQFNKTKTLKTDSRGIEIDTARTPPSTNGSVERSFLTIPPVLLFKVFNSSLEQVGKRYDILKPSDQDPNRSSKEGAAFAQAFEEGLETFPILSKILGAFVPRVNWSLRWNGLEKLPGVSSVVQTMSLEHNYTSSFRKDFHYDLSTKSEIGRAHV